LAMAQSYNSRYATAPMLSNGIRQAGSRPILRRRLRQPSVQSHHTIRQASMHQSLV
jgi:hypothetical protein